jgi:hypothetical protein
MKYVCAFFYGGIHRSVYLSKSKPPFNSVLGETYQGINEDGCKAYCEQTLHHPTTFNFYVTEPNKKFELMGFGSITAHLDGLNKIKGWREGKNIMKLKGDLFTWANFKTRISGIIMGDRVYNFFDTLTIKDFKNKIECVVTLQDEVDQGIISKLFGSKKEIQYDEGKIEIKRFNPDTKQKELVCTGYGSWLGQIYFGEKCYWSILDEQQKWVSDEGSYILPSDGRKRKDLQAVLKNDIELAQKEKEYIEELQRTDQKLRENYEAKKK